MGERIMAIVACECCGARPRLGVPVLGVYVPGARLAARSQEAARVGA